MFYYAEIIDKQNNEIIERSLIATADEIKGYNYAEDRFMEYYNGDDTVAYNFVPAYGDNNEVLNSNIIKLPISENVDINIDFFVVL